MKKTKKLQKPIDKDIHLKYRCKKCGLDHWLSYREASTPNFKVVCTCGRVFKVKQISGCLLRYKASENKVTKKRTKSETEKDTTVSDKNKDIKINNDVVVETPKERKTIPSEILEKSVKLLLSYGFTKSEATKLVTKTYFSVPVDDYPTLVKYTLQSIGGLENGIVNTQTI